MTTDSYITKIENTYSFDVDRFILDTLKIVGGPNLDNIVALYDKMENAEGKDFTDYIIEFYHKNAQDYAEISPEIRENLADYILFINEEIILSRISGMNEEDLVDDLASIIAFFGRLASFLLMVKPIKNDPVEIRLFVYSWDSNFHRAQAITSYLFDILKQMTARRNGLVYIDQIKCMDSLTLIEETFKISCDVMGFLTGLLIKILKDPNTANEKILNARKELFGSRPTVHV